MITFIKLHHRIPNIEGYKSQRFGVIRCQDGWKEEKGDEVFFNINNIESFSDYKVNDIDVCETSAEIMDLIFKSSSLQVEELNK